VLLPDVSLLASMDTGASAKVTDLLDLCLYTEES
jgi:hypothetical protein